MSNALTLSQPGMWDAIHADDVDAWQMATRRVELTKKIARHPELAALFDEALMALDDGVPVGPFTAAADVLHMARQRAAAQRQQQGAPDGNGHGPQATFTGNNGVHPATSAQVTS